MRAMHGVPDFISFYDLIPKYKKKEFVNMLGYKTCSGFSSKQKLTKDEYEFLVKYTEQFDTNSNNTVLGYVEFDRAQVMQHYDALCKLIGGAAFHEYTPNQKEDLKAYRFNLKLQLENEHKQ